MVALKIAAITVMLLAASATAFASPIIYFYQGNPLETSGVYECPPVCSISGSFIVETPLEANRPLATELTPLWYSFSNGLNTITPTNTVHNGADFFFSTNASGAIDEWSIQLVMTTPGPWIETWHTPSGFNSVVFAGQDPIYTADWTFVYGCTPTVCSPIGSGFLGNNQGTWTSMPFEGELPVPVPEPATLLLVGSGVAIALKNARGRRN